MLLLQLGIWGHDHWLCMMIGGVVHEHEEGEWEACDCGFGFQDVKVEGSGRESEWGGEGFLCPGFVSEYWWGGWFWIVS